MPERVQKGQGTMRAFTFENATKIYFGGGCVKEHLLEAVKPYGETVMLAYGGGSIKTNGIYQEVMDVLKLAGKQVIEFSGIMPNPTYSKVMEGKKVVQENQVDLILAWTAARRSQWRLRRTRTSGRNTGSKRARLILSRFRWA